MLQCISVILAFGVNTIVFNVILENFIENSVISFAVSVLLVVICAGSFLTPIGTWVMRKQYKLQRPTELERQRIDPIFLEVYKRAKKRTPLLPNNIQWFIVESDEENAVAIGRHTIALYIGLLEKCSDSEIAAVLAHEFGHIAHWDVIHSVLIVECNFIVIKFKDLLIRGFRIIFLGVGYLFSRGTGDKGFFVFYDYLSRLFNWMLNIYISMIYHVCTLPSLPACLKQEYAADKYAAELGLYDPMVNILTRLPSPTWHFKLSLVQMLHGNHPKNEKRIERLKTFSEESAKSNVAV